MKITSIFVHTIIVMVFIARLSEGMPVDSGLYWKIPVIYPAIDHKDPAPTTINLAPANIDPKKVTDIQATVYSNPDPSLDEEGLYTADPKKDKGAKFIPRISVAELKALDLRDCVVEPPVLDMMQNAAHRRSIRIVNGLVKGNLTRALNGEAVGTEIYAD